MQSDVELSEIGESGSGVHWLYLKSEDAGRPKYAAVGMVELSSNTIFACAELKAR